MWWNAKPRDKSRSTFASAIIISDVVLPASDPIPYANPGLPCFGYENQKPLGALGVVQ